MISVEKLPHYSYFAHSSKSYYDINLKKYPTVRQLILDICIFIYVCLGVSCVTITSCQLLPSPTE